jgi:hypothetical protein
MSSDVVLSGNHEASGGLPPVAPPSGKFIIQLFLVPGLIVTVAVLMWVSFKWLVGGETTPDALLGRLENANPDVRWRAANELAQRLKRDDRLASNPKVALRLAALLRKSLEELDRTEQTVTGSQSKERETLRSKRKDIEFLSPCLGNLILATGAPLLTEIALRNKGGDQKTTILLRRQAVWALANLGENLKRFRKLPSDQGDSVREELRQAELRAGEEGHWARLTLRYLEGSEKNIGVIAALARCADTKKDPVDDPFLRELVAHALTFWEGDAQENALAEKTLVALAHDDGHGVRIEIGEND